MHSGVWSFSMCCIVWNTFPPEDLVYDHMFHKCMLFPSFHLWHISFGAHYVIFVFFFNVLYRLKHVPTWRPGLRSHVSQMYVVSFLPHVAHFVWSTLCNLCVFLMCCIVWNTFPREDLVYDHMFHKCMLFPSFHLWHISFGAHYAIFVFSFSGCGIITCGIPFSLCWLSDVEVLPLVDALPPLWRKSPTRAMTSSLLNFVWLIGLELLFLQLSTYRMYALMIETSKPQKNNFLHHFSVLRRKQYVAQYWSAVSTPPIIFM